MWKQHALGKVEEDLVSVLTHTLMSVLTPSPTTGTDDVTHWSSSIQSLIVFPIQETAPHYLLLL